LVVPTSRSVAPERRMMSGMRELPADLDQLAPRYDDLLPAGEALEREQHRRGTIVHDERSLGARQSPEEGVDVE